MAELLWTHSSQAFIGHRMLKSPPGKGREKGGDEEEMREKVREVM